MNNNGWLNNESLLEMRFKSIGKNVLISSKCSIYGAHNIEIGDNVRIDDFCVLACIGGKLKLEGNNHIASFCYINSGGSVTFEQFSAISSKCSLYSSTDVYDGSYLTGPTVPKEYTKMHSAPIILKKHVVVGTGSTILPGCIIGLGSAIGACSLVVKDIPDFKIAFGIPAKPMKNRKTDTIELEKKYLETIR